MKWEDLKVYTPLKKDELKVAYKDFIKIIASNLDDKGFKLYNRRLIRKSNDLYQIIHIDTRGSWAGLSENYKIDIAIVVDSDKNSFVRKLELSGTQKFEDIVKGIRNHYRLTKEYPLLADFIVRKINDSILNYFDKYSSSTKIIDKAKDFPINQVSRMTQRNETLILFSELNNESITQSLRIIDDEISFYKSFNNLSDYIAELNFYKDCIMTKNWIDLKIKLNENRIENNKIVK